MQRFDWRWIGAIGLIVLLTQVRWLPWYALAGLLAAGGGYFLMVGWNTWRRRSGSSGGKKVTYWRGQRIEVAPTRRRAAALQLKDIGPALIFLLIGGAMVLAAANMIFRNLAILL